MKKSKLQKVLMSALTVTMLAGATLTAGATTNPPASVECATSDAAAVVAQTTTKSATATVPTTSDVTVNGQKIVTAVKGAYLAKEIGGLAVMTSTADLATAYSLKAGQTPYILVLDTDVKKSHRAMDSLNAAATAINAQMGPVLNIDLGYRENGKYYELSRDGADIMMSVALPEDFSDANATYAVIVVRMGGAVKVLEDLDGNADTVTFNTAGGLGCYAIVKY